MLMADRPCVLVVEDNDDLREALGIILEDAGHTVVTAANGQAALGLATAQAPGVVLLDLQMPVMSGQEALAALRQLPQHIPVVFMTAGLRARQEAVRHGADAHLEKPFDIDALLTLVARFCTHA